MNHLFEAAKEVGLLYLAFIAIQHISNILKTLMHIDLNNSIENPYVFFVCIIIAISILYYRNVNTLNEAAR